MEGERASVESFHMSRDASEGEKKLIDCKEVIDCRWHLHRKPATKKVKARVVARQIKHYNDELDTFAATATTVGARVLLAYLAHKIDGKEPWTAFFGDVKTAFLHATLPADQRVYLRPPMTERLHDKTRIWVALKALYGLRQAPRLSQEHLAAVS